MFSGTEGISNGKGATIASASIVFGAALTCIGFLYWDGLTDMVQAWSREEYSHGYIIPFVAAYLIARRLPMATGAASGHRWVGPVVAVVAVTLGLIGSFSHIADVTQYGFMQEASPARSITPIPRQRVRSIPSVSLTHQDLV